MTESDPYGYDRATDTVRVSRHDLHRLLLQFRTELERDPECGWSHMADYDLSFERLADAVDHARSVSPLVPDSVGPDYRMRCKRTEGYAWPDHPPYNGQPIQAVKLRSARYLSHYAYRGGGRDSGTGLCGFGFTWKSDGAKVIADEPTCRECVREKAFADASRKAA